MLVDLNPKIGSKFGMIFLIEQNKFKIDTLISLINMEVGIKHGGGAKNAKSLNVEGVINIIF